MRSALRSSDHRLRAAQRDRGLRHRRPDVRRAAELAFLALLGLIGGAPTFLGTIVGQAWTSEALSVLFLALAAGSILYVVLQLVKVMQRAGHVVLVSWMILAGLLLGFGTELMLKAAGI